jgi:hypothetical protein
VAEDEPRPAEDALHLQLEDRRIGVHRAMHAVGLDQHRQPLAVEGAHGRRDRKPGGYDKGVAGYYRRP